MEPKITFCKECLSCLDLSQHIAPISPPPLWSNANSSSPGAQSSISFTTALAWCSGYPHSRSDRMWRRPLRWVCTPIRSATGDSDGPQGTSACTMRWDGGVPPVFPPLDHALVQAVACALVAETEPPLSRQALTDVTVRAPSALGKPISRSTVWRILATDAIKPWRYKDWIFPRAPHCADKAGPILDWSAGPWEGQPLGPTDHILSADEKTSLQARLRCHPTLSSAPDRPAHSEHEYKRGGALPYLAAWDVRRGYVMGRCEPPTGIEPLGRLVHPVLAQEPYRSADRLCWIVDNGSSHRGDTAMHRLPQVDSRLQVVHTPVHASWLNQVEISFSIIQRKVLTPNDFANLEAVQLRLAWYEDLSNQCPTPFQWKFDRIQLTTLLAKIEAHQTRLAAAQLHRSEEAA
jgi:DDE superfamily endonuclease